MITVLPGFISPLVVSYLTYQNQTVQQWKKVFLITGSMLLISGTLFMLFADSEEQTWNKHELETDKDEESQPLNDGNNNKAPIILKNQTTVTNQSGK
jgi:hypothetical protein